MDLTAWFTHWNTSSIVRRFHSNIERADAVQKSLDTAVKAYHEIQNNHAENSHILSERAVIIRQHENRLRELVKLSSAFNSFVRKISKKFRSSTKLQLIIEQLSTQSSALNEIQKTLKSQIQQLKITQQSDEFDTHLENDCFSKQIEEIEKSITSLSTSITHSPAKIAKPGIAGLATVVTFLVMTTSTLAESIESQPIQKQSSQMQFQNTDNLFRYNPLISTHRGWEVFDCKGTSKEEILQNWSHFSNAHLYDTPSNNNIREYNGAVTITVKIKKFSGAVDSMPAFHNETQELLQNRTMQISLENFNAIIDDVKKTINENYVPFEYFEHQLSKEEIIEETIKFTTFWEGGWEEKRYTDSEGYATIGIGFLIDTKKTTTKAIYENLSIAYPSKTMDEIAEFHKELLAKKQVLPQKNAERILRNQINNAYSTAKSVFHDFDSLPPDLKIILIDMTFNMGDTEVKSWTETPALINKGEIYAFAKSLKNWKWYRQVGRRAVAIQKYLLDKYALVNTNSKSLAKN